MEEVEIGCQDVASLPPALQNERKAKVSQCYQQPEIPKSMKGTGFSMFSAAQGSKTKEKHMLFDVSAAQGSNFMEKPGFPRLPAARGSNNKDKQTF